MKKFRFILVVAVIVLSAMTILVRYSFAQNMTSPSGFEIIDPTISAGGNDDQVSTTATYLLRESIGVSFMDERFESANYKLEVGTGYTFEAQTPSISYFSATDGTMENICGHGGCYDRARFELDAEGNPTDTLYLIEISDDSWTTVQYVDGPTHVISSSKDINDYLTETSWEGGAWTEDNVLGLTPGTEYKVRARALNGDFSESEAGPDQTASTTVPQIYLDLNIAGGTWSSTSAPYSIDLGEVSKTSVTTATDYIWIDLGSNALSGAILSVRDANNGLYSATTGETIASQSEDLNTQSEGYGLKIDTSKRLPASGQPGFLRESTTYNAAGGDEVGAISTSPTTILCSIEETGGNCSGGTGTPVHEGRAAIWIKARSSFTRGSATDYTDTITFSATGTF
jgi:hypothetical protein